ncbi:MAG: NAD(P)H-hydrate epimerase [Myxococcota bacterium]|jgi:NAD(P)H-hydrate epimerase
MTETSEIFPPPVGEVPWLSTAQMVEVDRAMMEDYRILLMQMMENAGRDLAHLSRQRFLGGDPRGRAVVVLAGKGGNGGGAMVCARRLWGWGAQVHVYLSAPEADYTGVPDHQLDVLRRMGVPLSSAAALGEAPGADLIIDGVIGYSLRGSPRGDAARMVRWANEQPAPTLSLDVPSGVDTATGTVHQPAVRATATMTLALPKEGLRAPGVAANVGELYLADISVPPALYAGPGLGLEVGSLFALGDIVRLQLRYTVLTED